MNTSPFSRRGVIRRLLPAVCLFWLGVLPLASQAVGQDLELGDVLSLARERNPRIQALEAAALAAGHRESVASALPDPAIQMVYSLWQEAVLERTEERGRELEASELVIPSGVA